ncbi:MAG: hypothetical protein K2P25_11640 [Lachnospiraceae bacterium]|nr:hypothetical protein [Lachnospiraceae bacterium]
MTAFEIISIFIGILTLLIIFGNLIIAFLSFLAKRKIERKNKKPILSSNGIGSVYQDI